MRQLRQRKTKEIIHEESEKERPENTCNIIKKTRKFDTPIAKANKSSAKRKKNDNPLCSDEEPSKTISKIKRMAARNSVSTKKKLKLSNGHVLSDVTVIDEPVSENHHGSDDCGILSDNVSKLLEKELKLCKGHVLLSRILVKEESVSEKMENSNTPLQYRIKASESNAKRKKDDSPLGSDEEPPKTISKSKKKSTKKKLKPSKGLVSVLDVIVRDEPVSDNHDISNDSGISSNNTSEIMKEDSPVKHEPSTSVALHNKQNFDDSSSSELEWQEVTCEESEKKESDTIVQSKVKAIKSNARRKKDDSPLCLDEEAPKTISKNKRNLTKNSSSTKKKLKPSKACASVSDVAVKDEPVLENHDSSNDSGISSSNISGIMKEHLASKQEPSTSSAVDNKQNSKDSSSSESEWEEVTCEESEKANNVMKKKKKLDTLVQSKVKAIKSNAKREKDDSPLCSDDKSPETTSKNKKNSAKNSSSTKKKLKSSKISDVIVKDEPVLENHNSSNDSGISSNNISDIMKEDLASKQEPSTSFAVDNKQNSKDSSGSESEWEEVENNSETDSLDNYKPNVLKEGVEITIDCPDLRIKKRRNKKFDIYERIRLHINRIRKNDQLSVHKTHLLCLLAHGIYVNKILNSDVIKALALSHIPDVLLNMTSGKKIDKIDLSGIQKVVKWFRGAFDFENKKSVFLNLFFSMAKSFNTTSAMNPSEYNLLFIVIARILRFKVRLCISLYPVSYKTLNLLKKPSNKTISGFSFTKETKKRILKHKKETSLKKKVIELNKEPKLLKSKQEQSSQIKKVNRELKQPKSKQEQSSKIKKYTKEKVLRPRRSVKSYKLSSDEDNDCSDLDEDFVPKDEKSSDEDSDLSEDEDFVVNDETSSDDDLEKFPKRTVQSIPSCKKNVTLSSNGETEKAFSKKEPNSTKRKLSCQIKKSTKEKVPRFCCSARKSPKLSSDEDSNRSDQDEDLVLKDEKSRGEDCDLSEDDNFVLKDEMNSNDDLEKLPKRTPQSIPSSKKSATPSSNEVTKKVFSKGKKETISKQKTVEVKKEPKTPKQLKTKQEQSSQIKKSVKVLRPRRSARKSYKLSSDEDKDQDEDFVLKDEKSNDEDRDLSEDEDFVVRDEISSDDDLEKLPARTPQSKRKSQSKKSNRKVLSSNSLPSSPNQSAYNSKSVICWAEVYSKPDKQWISVECANNIVNRPYFIEACAPKPVTYILAYDNDSYVKDVTRRYCDDYMTAAVKLRADTKWWEETLKPFLPPDTMQNKAEDKKLNEMLVNKPLPQTIQGFKNHPLYALKRHVLKLEAIYPPDAPPVGFFRKEPVYARDCVHLMRTRENWFKKQGRIVKVGEKPYKIVTGPKWDKVNRVILKGCPYELFGYWQTKAYEPPVAVDGKVPRNEYGNVELFKPSMLPKGTVYLQLPGLNRIAKKLGIDCAPAVVGFGGNAIIGVHAKFDGFVICEEFKDTITAAWEEEQENIRKREEEKREKRIYGNWKKLIRGLLIRERIKLKYDIN